MEIYWARITGIVLSLIFLSYIIHLVRTKRLKEEYSIFWIFLGTVIFILSLWKKLLIRLSHLLHFPQPIYTIFFFGIFTLLGICLYLSIKLSDLHRKINILSQEFTLDKKKDEKYSDN